MDIERGFKLGGIAFIIFWVLSALSGMALTGLIIYILYRVAVMLS